MQMQQLYCGESLTGGTGDASDVVIISLSLSFFLLLQKGWEQ